MSLKGNHSFSTEIKDCINDAFYITNIKSDVTSDNISKAKSLAENEARSKAFLRLFLEYTLIILGNPFSIKLISIRGITVLPVCIFNACDSKISLWEVKKRRPPTASIPLQ